MVSRRKRGRGGGDAVIGNGTVAVPPAPGYEQLRDQRVRENQERMQKLGIIELSLKLKSTATASPRQFPKNCSRKEPPNGSPADEPQRRSSRLKTLTPVSYAEIRPKTKKENSRSIEIRIKEGSQPEIYTEEDAKLLGDCESNWILGVDGYGQDGKRVYDPVNGESCHQCRYGENVMEVNLNPNWICPVCRGICNCSQCRQSKGWMPTGAIYRKARNLGFKSVAHYLIQTRCSQTNQKGSSSEHVGAGDSSQALPNTGLENDQEEHDNSQSSVDSLDFECIME
ncbi:uncharacterized protein LOC120070121 isoform X2 [Benincasa hispida]|uniref:uncharacterized protein LOC120070121 isoform X2 n=1 Tax=Benincasa hispida TaxID=102211 RepID=UPI0019007053|nr:uncharacterized protein LOC120070121 isoform X2 [Benincasa hispida]